MPMEGSLDPLRPLSQSYVDAFEDILPGAPEWGPGEGHVDLSALPAEDALLWQSRTCFGAVARDWTDYPQDAQAKINRAMRRGDTKVELSFGASRFLVDLERMKQYNRADRTKVRDVRRATVHAKKWIVMSKRAESHWVVLMSRAAKMLKKVSDSGTIAMTQFFSRFGTISWALCMWTRKGTELMSPPMQMISAVYSPCRSLSGPKLSSGRKTSCCLRLLPGTNYCGVSLSSQSSVARNVWGMKTCASARSRATCASSCTFS